MPQMPPRHRPPGWRPYQRPPLDEGERFYSSQAWRDLREAAKRRDGYCCVKCGARGGRLIVDHLRPRRDGGSDTLDNLRCLCSACDNRLRAGR